MSEHIAYDSTGPAIDPVVGVVMGSSSDWPTMCKSVEILESFGVAHEARVVSAHRMPDEMFAYAEAATSRGLRAIIAGAGGAAHLPGMLSGHWTLDACVTSQYEQQVRAVCGLALGSAAMTAPAIAMVNLLGDLWERGDPDWAVIFDDPHAKLHLYGKSAARPGRKMGHLTVTAPATNVAAARALELRSAATR